MSEKLTLEEIEGMREGDVVYFPSGTFLNGDELAKAVRDGDLNHLYPWEVEDVDGGFVRYMLPIEVVNAGAMRTPEGNTKITLTPNEAKGMGTLSPGCDANDDEGWKCTRELGHEGHHVAATASLLHSVCAVWEDAPVVTAGATPTAGSGCEVDFSQYRFAAHPDGRTAMRIQNDLASGFPWIVTHDGKYFRASDADLAREGFRPAHLLTDLTDSLVAGVEALGIPAWEAYPDGEIPAGTPHVIVWNDGNTAIRPHGIWFRTATRGYGFRCFLLAPPAPSRPEGAAPVQSALAAAGVEVTPEQADALAKAGVRAPENTPHDNH